MVDLGLSKIALSNAEQCSRLTYCSGINFKLIEDDFGRSICVSNNKTGRARMMTKVVRLPTDHGSYTRMSIHTSCK